MHIKPNFTLQVAANTGIVIDTSAGADFNRMITLNQTAVFIWNKIKDGINNPEKLAEALVTEYEVSPETARTDVDKFIAQMKEQNILE